MNWVLITCTLLALVAPFEADLANQSELTTSAAQFTFVNLDDSERNQTTKVPFTINRNEVLGASTIWADLFGDRIALQGRATGEYILPKPLSVDNPIEFVSLGKSRKGTAGEDAVIWQKKESLEFNAQNTAITEVLFVLTAFGFNEGQLVASYPIIVNHPKIPALRQLMLEEKGYPDSDSLLGQITDISYEIAVVVVEQIRPE